MVVCYEKLLERMTITHVYIGEEVVVTLKFRLMNVLTCICISILYTIHSTLIVSKSIGKS